MCCSYHGTVSQLRYSKQMHQTHLDNHGSSTRYTTDDSIHMAGDERDGDAPLLIRCRSPDHPDGPSSKKKCFISYQYTDALCFINFFQTGIKIEKLHTISINCESHYDFNADDGSWMLSFSTFWLIYILPTA